MISIRLISLIIQFLIVGSLIDVVTTDIDEESLPATTLAPFVSVKGTMTTNSWTSEDPLSGDQSIMRQETIGPKTTSSGIDLTGESLINTIAKNFGLTTQNLARIELITLNQNQSVSSTFSGDKAVSNNGTNQENLEATDRPPVAPGSSINDQDHSTESSQQPITTIGDELSRYSDQSIGDHEPSTLSDQKFDLVDQRSAIIGQTITSSGYYFLPKDEINRSKPLESFDLQDQSSYRYPDNYAAKIFMIILLGMVSLTALITIISCYRYRQREQSRKNQNCALSTKEGISMVDNRSPLIKGASESISSDCFIQARSASSTMIDVEARSNRLRVRFQDPPSQVSFVSAHSAMADPSTLISASESEEWLYVGARPEDNGNYPASRY